MIEYKLFRRKPALHLVRPAYFNLNQGKANRFDGFCLLDIDNNLEQAYHFNGPPVPIGRIKALNYITQSDII